VIYIYSTTFRLAVGTKTITEAWKHNEAVMWVLQSGSNQLLISSADVFSTNRDVKLF